MNKKRLYFVTAKRLLLLVTVVMTVCIANAQNCRYCGGTGTVVKNLGTVQYGLSGDYKVRCSTCGAVTLKSTGHAHIHCTHCGGSGRTGTSGNSRESGSDVSTSNPFAQSIAWTLKYGLPMSDEESAAVNRLDNNTKKKYMDWRNYLNAQTMWVNRNNECLVAIDLNYFDNQMKIIGERTSQLSSGFSVPQDLYTIANCLLDKFKQSVIRYRNYLSAQQSIGNLQNQLDNYILMRPW